MFWTLALARQQSSVTDHNVIAILLGAKAGSSINPNVCGGGPLIADAPDVGCAGVALRKDS